MTHYVKNGTHEDSDYERIIRAFMDAGVSFSEGTGRAERGEDIHSALGGPRKYLSIAFETTKLCFDAKGAYIGREYMGRDECDYFITRGAKKVQP